ncbi:MAG: hypothetical protein DWI03_05880 [Planctomycetota bacterium]|nr:MAG: hypothetical protein DWI03_05880 [Planctomycetota bacterium]
MNVSRVFHHLIATAVAAAVFAAAPGVTRAQQAESQLKWTPHRSSTGPTQDTPATVAAPAAVETPALVNAPAAAAVVPAAPAAMPSGPPASVSLPDEVPVVRPAAPRAPARYAPPVDRGPDRSGDWSSPNRISGAMRQAFDPDNPAGLFGINVMRSPQGDAVRPILAPEGRQAVAMQQAADRTALARQAGGQLGGGLAPRYAPLAGAPANRPRSERLAMNADGIPSVMRQAQAGAVDNAGPTPGAAAAKESLPAPVADAPGRSMIVEESPMEIESIAPGMDMADGMSEAGPDELLMGEYPSQLHVESFYDDPYACEDEECMLPCVSHGRICEWLRRFGKPYYGWRWYRDFTASAGVTAFTNSTDLGINGNYGTNEYLNWAMPFWNAFGLGWQLGWRGTQTNFQPASIEAGTTTLSKDSRTQQFITTGFFTRAFEGRGLQGGAVYDYLNDSWFDNSNVSQIRTELSYVWGYHEFGFWGAFNVGDQNTIFGPVSRRSGVTSTLDMYCGFYRLQFGDANEWKVWGGATNEQDGVVGSLLRAPLARSLAMEGTFNYVIPGSTQTINLDGRGGSTSFSPGAWNVGVNIVYYPAGRSRRGLASPYRPLFEVADNGSMIRRLSKVPTP